MLKKIISLLFCSAFMSGCVVVQPVDQQGTTGYQAAPAVNSIASASDNSGVDAQVLTELDEVVRGASSASSGDTGFVLKALDPIYLRFSGVSDQADLQVVIDGNGDIGLLHIKKPVKAAGLTPTELEEKIEQLYTDNGIYKNVSVNVTMTAKIYYVQGEVNAPGQFELSGSTTLLQAIAGARGYTPFAWKRKVTITRNGTIIGPYNTKKIEKNPSLDVKIEHGDVINVPQTWW